MIAAGIFDGRGRVELLDGWIVTKITHNPLHDSTIDLLVAGLEGILPGGWYLRVQSAITTTESQPEPGVAVVRGPRGRYRQSHPGPQDVALLIEVADSSLAQDCGYKAGLYARSGIPVYWIVNLVDARIEVYTEPSGAVPDPGYRRRQDYTIDGSVPLTIGGQEVGQLPVRQVLS
jgi:Uma2 family endonuclease